MIRSFALFALALALTVFACGPSEPKKGDVYVEQNTTPPDAKQLYTSKCKVCHGADGKLQNNGASDLSISKLTTGEKIGVITYGRNTMVGWKGVMSPEEIKAVAEYIDGFIAN